ncbi:hypothetical protein KP509_14G014400 [Ceratopteris richardii]|uniref:Pentatricopeptide repeat-containing protein n=1 Tax=Ceratopteris richardii TaxID=49495 RepID=A0A8T2T7A5_CERRI|nr:hypothetical protein KP509_14G014400 [Ceratopteris richardii]
MYAGCGLLIEAREVLFKLRYRRHISWSSLMSGYIDNRLGSDAGAIAMGSSIHREAMEKNQIHYDGTTAVDMYAKCGMLENAQKTFDELAVQNVVSWTALITGYAQNGSGEKALYCFEQMRRDGLSPNESTFSCILKACGAVGDFWKGCEVHVEIMKAALLERDIVIANALVDMYAKCGDMVKAQTVFNELSVPDVVSWSTLISGYAQHLHYEQALCCFECMKPGEGGWTHFGRVVKATNRRRFRIVLAVCVSRAALGYATTCDIPNHVDDERSCRSELMLGLSGCGLLIEAREVLFKLRYRRHISWSSLMSGYIDNRLGSDAGAIAMGSSIHREIHYDGTAAVDMYAKCGMLENAQKTFDELAVQNVVSWTALITGYAQNGSGEKALYCFEQMQRDGLSPNESTFSCILKACGAVGDFWKGCEVHVEIMKAALLERDIVIANALVDMYAKCGDMVKAQTVFNELSVPDVVSWSTLISGYAQHLHYEQALCCFECMKPGGGLSKYYNLCLYLECLW